ncbi:MAG: DUF2066 domain-containing protein [Woeseiaceae bacterium]
MSLAVLVTVLAITGTPLARAVEVPTLYTAEVAFDSDARNGRERAYDLALSEILLRVAGSGLGGDAASINQLFPDSSRYVVQFRQGSANTMWVSFDGAAIERTLREAGQAVWGAERPLTVVWLAVDWGQGRREIVAADDPDNEQRDARSINRHALLRERVLKVAERRGLPLVFPLMDARDIQNVTFSDIWGGFDEAVIAASRRYDADSILIGRIQAAGGGRESWNYYFSGDARRWNGSPEQVVNQIADLLAAELTVGGNAPLVSVAMRVAGIVSVDAYGNLSRILDNVSVIEEYRIKEVSGDRVTVQVNVRGGAERLRRALQFSGLVEQEVAQQFGDRTDEVSLEFYYGR